MKVKFLKDWQGESPASYKKDDVIELDDDLAWELAARGFVKFIFDISPKEKRARKRYKQAIKGV